MKVKLQYFKSSGKYYSSGELDLAFDHMFEFAEYVKGLADDLLLPGLMMGHSPYYVLMTVPEHPHNYPCLIIPTILEK